MPFPAMGQNNDPQAIRRSCPSRDYVACFTKELRERYPFTQYHKRHPPPSCYTGAARARAVLQALHLVGDDPECRAPSPDEVPMLSSPVEGSAPLQLCPASPPPPPPPHAARLRCDSAPAEVQARAVLLIGVPSTPSKLGRERRDAIRAAWMRDEAVGSEAVVCFVLSAQTEQPALGALQASRPGPDTLSPTPDRDRIANPSPNRNPSPNPNPNPNPNPDPGPNPYPNPNPNPNLPHSGWSPKEKHT